MPNIPEAIKEKIKISSVFIADIGIVCSNEKRKFPNPNVLIELGYALALLPFESIICLCRPEDDISQMPFDIKVDRISKMPLDLRNKTFDEIKKASKKELKDWIHLSLENGPKKELREFLKKYFKLPMDTFPKNLTLGFGETAMPAQRIDFLTQKRFQNLIKIEAKKGNSILPFPDVDFLQFGYEGKMTFLEDV